MNLKPLDHRIKYYKLYMFLDNLDNFPEYQLPKGYSFVFYQDGDRDKWIEIESSAGEFKNYEEGIKAWNEYYKDHEDELYNRMVFIKHDNEYVGTLTAYYDVKGIDDPSVGRLHWFSIKEEYQGKGLAKPLITFVLHIMKELGYRNAKLSTQTNSWLAIKIYLDFGFKPYNESLGWGIVKHILKRKELDAYEEISDIFEV